jgi:hypothetical protein
MPGSVGYGGAWKGVTAMYAGYMGDWKAVIAAWVGSGGDWKLWFGAGGLRLDASMVAASLDGGNIIGYADLDPPASGGSLTPAVMNGGGNVLMISDLASTNLILYVEGFLSDPGSGYISDMFINGLSMGTAIGAPTYTYLGAGAAEWVWPGIYGFVDTGSYAIQIAS